ncbi:AraC family transcriptional regulator [Morganella morganii]|uniref:AraC family transcriptional regulator n=1 Tax=Morganella morganii TaxID=582 RepID=UPI0021CE8CD6|nr:AraC family transcriptional regulator [Morganella morganii]MCU6274015.1 AraC family transcriptional regulator [Morganella morganii]
MVRHILNWVERNIHTDANISELVREVGYSRKKLEVLFRQQTGLSPGEYLTRRKMSRAGMLLRLTALSVTEISLSLHFHSAQNFARAFKKFIGVTPTEYRRHKAWLTHVLQKPLLMDGATYTTKGIVELPAVRLTGRSSVCSHNFLSVSDSTAVINIIKSAFCQRTENSSKEEVCVACRLLTSVSLAEGRAAQAGVEVIVPCHPDESQETMISAGKYWQFNFSGSWEEYVVFTRLIYFELSEQGVARRDGFDLTFFSLVNDDNEAITCRHYIPVE